MKDLHAPSQEVTPRIPTELISFDGAELLWIDAILFVPAIFGIMFLPDVLRAIVLSLCIALVVAYFVASIVANQLVEIAATLGWWALPLFVWPGVLFVESQYQHDL